MNRHIDITNRLITFLKKNGYPEESIIIEWKVSEKLIADVAVIDPTSKKALMLFEVKQGRSEISDLVVQQVLQKLIDTIGDNTISLYVVYDTKDAPFFEILTPRKTKRTVILERVVDLPSFSISQTAHLSKEILKNDNAKRRTFDMFKIICWILSLLLSFLLYLDFRNIIKITPERLGIFAIVVTLIVIPFSKKLNILGVEFERLQNDKEKSEKAA